MEEQVGQVWHRLITRATSREHPEAAVLLADMNTRLGLLFRALGGDPGLRLEQAGFTTHGGRRRWLARVAGVQRRVELAWRDEETLRLPARIALFPEPGLNRDLYLWLAALAAAESGVPETDWFRASQQRTLHVLRQVPGLAGRYRRLVAAQLALRIPPRQLPAVDAAAESAIRDALREPGSVDELPMTRRPPQPVHLWLHPTPPRPLDRRRRSSEPGDNPAGGNSRDGKQRKRRRAERVDEPDGRKGLMAFRLESLFSWTEYLPVDRTADDRDDPDAEQRADDLEVLSISNSRQPVATRLRFDLDLPAAGNDDVPLGEGIPLPEWDYRKQCLLPDRCRLQMLVAAGAAPCELPEALHAPARKLRRQFRTLLPARSWQRAQPDGSEVDLDAWLAHAAERRAGRSDGNPNLYRDVRNSRRDLACLLLADLSLSTDAHVDDRHRVIDVIRDSLFLFSEALAASGDRFALYGFSSRHRSHVRFHVIKSFEQRYGDSVRGRIRVLKPGYYTRMGAAIRQATTMLDRQAADQRLLLLLTDGKPNDLDRYEGRYGAEDTRMAIIEARCRGLTPFCVTIDERAEDYLPHLFGRNGFVLVRTPAELPRRLPALYGRLTGRLG